MYVYSGIAPQLIEASYDLVIRDKLSLQRPFILAVYEQLAVSSHTDYTDQASN